MSTPLYRGGNHRSGNGKIQTFSTIHFNTRIKFIPKLSKTTQKHDDLGLAGVTHLVEHPVEEKQICVIPWSKA